MLTEIPEGRRLPTYQELNSIVAELAMDKGEWAGLPVPITGHRLAIEDKNPWKPFVEAMQEEEAEIALMAAEIDTDTEIVNCFVCGRRNKLVIVLKDRAGRATCRTTPYYPENLKIDAMLQTMGISTIWSIDAELNAIMALAGIVSNVAMGHYYLCGTFMETSERSGITYVFRRLRPTLALRSDPKTGKVRYLGALCLHPIGYYEGTHGGSMVPTDDVIAHVLLMRADEHMFWRRANQHPIDRPEAGL